MTTPRDSTIKPVLDVAIVGAGVSGLYSGWRLLSTPSPEQPRTVALFESSDRVGGRLLSVTPPGMPEARIELGGMRFTTGHQLVRSLVPYLNLATEPFPVGQPANMAYLRGHRLRTADLNDPDKIPYTLTQAEREGLKDGFTAMAAGRFLQKVMDQPHVDLKTVPWAHLARTGRYEGHYLRDLPMRYLFNRSVSHEAFQFAEDTSGYDSIFFTWNAADGFPWNLADYGATIEYKRLQDGYESLPLTLRAKFEEAGGQLHLGHQLMGFDEVTQDDGSKLIEMHFKRDGHHHTVHARKLILAMPRRSLELLAQTGVVLGPDQHEVHRLIKSVTPIPLFKLALCYRERWWEKLGITQGQSVTDLPIRQCYYWPEGDGTQAGAILVYNDGLDLDYWCDLIAHPAKFQNKTLDGEVPWPEQEWMQHPAPELMVQEAHRQLLEIHGVEDRPDLQPYAAAFRDWGEDPFGGGANFWPQHVESHDVARKILKPVPEVPVFICGEAYSHGQGWVEGALETAEAMLQGHFGLGQPPYLQPGTKT
ncbi:MAG: amine oxidase [Rubrivivax sp.]|nr:MAG: amine oxidase [Rubrivivax sp.]